MERHSREDNIQHSQVVFFSNLPREEEKKRELLTIAGRFGIVEKHLFLTDQVLLLRLLEDIAPHHLLVASSLLPLLLLPVLCSGLCSSVFFSC